MWFCFGHCHSISKWIIDQYTKKWTIKGIIDKWVYYHFHQKFMKEWYKEWYTSKCQIILDLFSMKFWVDLGKHIVRHMLYLNY